MTTLFMRALASSLALGLLPACAEDGLSSLVETRPEPAGANCPYGGLRLDIGQDVDRDRRLDPREIAATEYVCNQRVDGRSVAVRTVAVPPGAECPAGGIRVESGIDVDDDRVLDDGEVEATTFVCDGRDGLTSLVRLVPIDADLTSATCPLGGTRVESGRDRDRDGVLDDDEVESFHSVCSIRVNEDLMLIDHAVEMPGANCAHGGTRVRFGLDDDGDRVLDAEEVEGAPLYLCNDQVLIAGKTALVRTSEASLQQCTFGGFVMSFGLDDDYDGTLDDGENSEIDGFRVVCNGNDGYPGLVEQTAVTGGECGSGVPGIRVASGLDLDRDGRLDGNEVTATETVCDGLPGLPGPAALVVQTDDVRFCEAGVVILTGTDWDLDSYLDSDEIDHETEICSGFDGHDALIEVYDGDSYCFPDVGVLLRTGTDWDDDGVLDGSEYVESVICGLE